MLREGKLSITHLGSTNIVISEWHYIFPHIDIRVNSDVFHVFQFPYLPYVRNLAYNNTSNKKTFVFIHE